MKRSMIYPFAVLAGTAMLTAQQPVFSSDDEVESVLTEAGPVSVKEIAKGLNHPWGLAFLPDGRLLVTERAGDLRVLEGNGKLSRPVRGVPKVFADGQGGLLDVALDPDFEQNGWVYLSYAESGQGGASTALGRGKWQDGRIQDFEVLFRQEPRIDGNKHFGGRIVFDEEGHLFLTLGERFQFDPAQDLSNHLGTVVRLNADGSVPDDNPFVGEAGKREEIWSYGHRNVQAAAVHPDTGDLWIVEMGPLGGDELNQPQKGHNYGWPVVSAGYHYNGSEIAKPETHPEFTGAVKYYSPVISPSGMAYYTGESFPEWQDSFFVGGLSSRQLVRIEIDGQEVAHEERIPLPERIRDVEQGPDGMLYVITDTKDGAIWRLEPLRPSGQDS
ncbi:MAG: PQQ-dependent sugar dehydrogenase [Verrucomicrobiota bacterium JB022]|nr:PQQ-dependent sugar dehydrogenase [Verrucomicrobiota bacterium JB022]